jgi:heme a synthase
MGTALAEPAALHAREAYVEADPYRLVRVWVWALAALVAVMVTVGGATRLTGSGLSITEWKPVTGALPPLSEAAWTEEFAKYRQSSQYDLVNRGMTLAEFKWIYGWEWGHRQLGRFLGLFFFLPLLWFWARGRISRTHAFMLLGIGTLGGLQATIGWIMVASGLKPGMTAVAPIKLTLHLTLASVIFACLVWFAVGLSRRPSFATRSPAAGLRFGGRGGACILLGLVFLQIALGGLVAGSKAGLTFNTWPLMDGRLMPQAATLFAVTPWIENFVDNVALVQFNHRLVAYLLVGFATWHAWAAWRRADSPPRPGGVGDIAPGVGFGSRAGLLAGLCWVQAALGVVTLLLAVPIWAGLTHQLLAMGILGLAVAHVRLS